jgi:hypothetical protein
MHSPMIHMNVMYILHMNIAHVENMFDKRINVLMNEVQTYE